jgi:predicted nucleic acid-binding protein
MSGDRPATTAALSWFTGLAMSDLVATLTLDDAAAVVAGRVRAGQPTPPTNGRRRGSKAEGRAGWVLDIQIAACAWVHGHAIVTDNQRDFAAIRDVIAELYPRVAALEVLPGPSL